MDGYLGSDLLGSLDLMVWPRTGEVFNFPDGQSPAVLTSILDDQEDPVPTLAC